MFLFLCVHHCFSGCFQLDMSGKAISVCDDTGVSVIGEGLGSAGMSCSLDVALPDLYLARHSFVKNRKVRIIGDFFGKSAVVRSFQRNGYLVTSSDCDAEFLVSLKEMRLDNYTFGLFESGPKSDLVFVSAQSPHTRELCGMKVQRNVQMISKVLVLLLVILLGLLYVFGDSSTIALLVDHGGVTSRVPALFQARVLKEVNRTLENHFVIEHEQRHYCCHVIPLYNAGQVVLIHPDFRLDAMVTAGISGVEGSLSINTRQELTVVQADVKPADREHREIEVDFEIDGEPCTLKIKPKPGVEYPFGKYSLHHFYNCFLSVQITYNAMKPNMTVRDILEMTRDVFDFEGCAVVIDCKREQAVIIARNKEVEEIIQDIIPDNSDYPLNQMVVNIANKKNYRVVSMTFNFAGVLHSSIYVCDKSKLILRASERQFMNNLSMLLGFVQMLETVNTKRSFEQSKDTMEGRTDFVTYSYVGEDRKLVRCSGVIGGCEAKELIDCGVIGKIMKFIDNNPDINVQGSVQLLKWNGGDVLAGVIRHTCQYDQVLDEEVSLLSITDLRSYFLDEETRNNVSQAFMIATVLNLHYDFCIEGHSHLRLCSELGYGPLCKKRVVDFVRDGDLQTLSFRRSVIKLKDAEGECQFYLSNGEKDQWLFKMTDFEKIRKLGSTADNIVPFACASDNFLFCYIDVLFDEVFGMLANDDVAAIFRKKYPASTDDLFELFVPDDRPKLRTALEAVKRSSVNVKDCLVRVNFDDQPTYYSVSMRLCLDSVVIFHAENVMAHKQMTDSTEETNQLIDRCLLYSSVSLWSFEDSEDESLIISSLPAAHEALRINWATIKYNIIAEDSEKAVEAIKQMLEAKDDAAVNVSVRMMFDSLYWFNISGVKAGDQVIGIMVDVTEIKRLSELAKIEKMKSQEANSAKSRFLANLSHEIRTPLNGMSGLLELLEGSKMDEASVDITKMIRESFTRLLELLNDSLDLAKIENERMKPQTAEFDTFESLASIIVDYEQQALNAGFGFEVKMQPGFPLTLLGDPLFFVRMIGNLTSLAVKFTESGTITIDFSADDNSVSFKTTNNKNPGFDSLEFDDPDSIFDAFPTIKVGQSLQSPGAALALVKAMCDLVNGDISIANDNDLHIVTLKIPYKRGKPAPKLTGNTEIAILSPEWARSESLKSHISYLGMNLVTAVTANTRFLIINAGQEDLARTAKATSPSINVFVVTAQKSTGAKDEFKRFSPAELMLLFEKTVIDIHNSNKPLRTTQSCDTLAVPTWFRVLVADDTSMNQLVMRKLLEKVGVSFDIVSNGQEVIDALAKQQYSVIFMDQQMPQMDGPAATRVIRASSEPYRTIPIIAMTASIMKEDEDECMNSGMDTFIGKPLSLLKIQKAIGFALAHSYNQH